MEQVLLKSKELKDCLVNSDFYKDYIFNKKTLESNTTIYDKVNDYRKLVFEYNNKINSGSNIPFEDELYLSKLYGELLLNRVAHNFLSSERKLYEMISSMHNILDSSLNEIF